MRILDFMTRSKFLSEPYLVFSNYEKLNFFDRNALVL